MGTLEGVGSTIGVVDRQTGLAVGVLLVEGHIDRGTSANAVVGSGVVVGPEAWLEDVTGAELEHVEQAVLETNGIVVAEEGIGGESGSDGEALAPFLEQEVVGQTDVEARGQLHLGGTGLDGEVVAGMVDHLQGEARAVVLHRGAPVLEGDTELELVVLASDVLNTSVDTEAGSRDVVGALSDEFDCGTAMDATGEAVGIGHIDVHVAGREGTIEASLGAGVGGDIDIAKAHGHDVDTQNTSIKDADAETEGVDSSATGEAAASTIEHGVGIGHFHALDKSETGDVAKHGVEATHIGIIDSTPTGTAGPGIDKQLRGARGSTTFIVASLS